MESDLEKRQCGNNNDYKNGDKDSQNKAFGSSAPEASTFENELSGVADSDRIAQTDMDLISYAEFLHTAEERYGGITSSVFDELLPLPIETLEEEFLRAHTRLVSMGAFSTNNPDPTSAEGNQTENSHPPLITDTRLKLKTAYDK